jgi:DNA repair exonuclease SbcCD nuclease subunit
MVRFIHTADWQIGKVFAGVDDEAKRTRLQDARIRVIDRIGKAAIEHDASFIVVAGDLFDSSTVPRPTVSAALSAIGQLERPVYVIPGNHDHGGAGGIWEQDYFRREHAQLAPNLIVLTQQEPVLRDDAALLPCPLLRRHEIDDPTAWLRSPDDGWQALGERPRIVLAHGGAHGFVTETMTDDEEVVGGAANRLDIERLPESEIDYIALGDWHGTKQVGAKAWYSGTPEPDRFAKGADYRAGQVLVVGVARGGAPEVREVPTGGIAWHRIEHSFTDDASLAALAEDVSARIGMRVDEDLVRMTLAGSLGFGARDELEQLLEIWNNRLIRLKLYDGTTTAPTDGEIDALTAHLGDPLIAQVAGTLKGEAAGSGEPAEVARLALRELHRLAG